MAKRTSKCFEDVPGIPLDGEDQVVKVGRPALGVSQGMFVAAFVEAIRDGKSKKAAAKYAALVSNLGEATLRTKGVRAAIAAEGIEL